MRARRGTIPLDVVGPSATRAAASLLALPELRDARVVALYAAVREELPTTPVSDALLARGVTLAYPRTVAGQRELVFGAVAHPRELVPGVWGIPEPAPGTPRLAPGEIDVFVVPGLAFDAAGGRIGWGAGHYDVTLALHGDAYRVGYAYEAQIVAVVPRERDDIAMDCVITEAAVRYCGGRTTG